MKLVATLKVKIDVEDDEMPDLSKDRLISILRDLGLDYEILQTEVEE